MFLAIDGTFVVQIIDFIVFLLVMNAVFFTPVRTALAKRRAYVNSVTADYDSAVTDARALRGQAEAKRAQARREGEERAAAERSSAAVEAAEIAAGYEAKAAGIIASAHAQVETEVDAARGREGELVRQLADMMLERTLGKAAR